jgi:uncharacterized cupredoxin-like copper-binding protein
MRKSIFVVGMMAILAGPAFATGNHAGGHDDDLTAIGRPGKAAKVVRTISISMLEKGDGSMSFDPASITVKKGETVRLRFTNKGENDHEFVMDTHEHVMEHKAAMEKFPDMEHEDPNQIRIRPKGKGEIIWTFTTAGDFDFACLIPGHHDLGMKGTIKVTAN